MGIKGENKRDEDKCTISNVLEDSRIFSSRRRKRDKYTPKALVLSDFSIYVTDTRFNTEIQILHPVIEQTHYHAYLRLKMLKIIVFRKHISWWRIPPYFIRLSMQKHVVPIIDNLQS